MTWSRIDTDCAHFPPFPRCGADGVGPTHPKSASPRDGRKDARTVKAPARMPWAWATILAQELDQTFEGVTEVTRITFGNKSIVDAYLLRRGWDNRPILV